MLSKTKLWAMYVMILVSHFNIGTSKDNCFELLHVYIGYSQIYQTIVTLSSIGFESSSSPSSQLGTIRYSPNLYINYNQMCTSNSSDNT